MRPINRTARLAMAGLSTVAAAALLAGCAGDAGGDASSSAGTELSGDIIWADYGGPTNESRQIAYFDGFYDETGVEVISTSIEDAVYHSILEGGSPDYDVFQAGASEALPYEENLLEVPAESQGDLLPVEMQPYYMGGFFFGIAQGWLTETYPDGGPQDWADFFDTETYPGKRAWPGAPGSFDSSYEIALLADGVAPEDIYPIDFERATAKLDSIRDDLVFYQSYPETQQLLTSGSVAIAVTVTGQFQALINAGEDVTIQWNQAFSVPSGFVASSIVDNPNEVLALAAWMNDPENQAVFTERTGYGPVNSEVFDYLSEEVAANVVNAPDHTNLVTYDDTWRGENYEDLVNNYTAWLAG